MRAPVDHIAAPQFPAPLPWFNVAPLRMDQQLGRPVLIEFWDFCRPNSIRTLPYMKAWHERYSDAGLRVIGVHASGFEPSADPAQVEAAVARLEIPYPVVVDVELEIWSLYGNLGWPARYLFNQGGTLFDYHYGEGAYDETEHAIQELLGVEAAADRADPPRGRARRRAGAPDRRRRRALQRALPGRRRVGGPRRPRRVTANGRSLDVEHPGCYELIAHERSTHGELALDVGDGRPLLRRVLHARSGGVIPSTRLTSRGGPPSSSSDRESRRGRDSASGRDPRKPGSWTQQPVLISCAPVGARHSTSSSPGSGPARWVWPNTTCAAPTSEAARPPRRTRGVRRGAARVPRCRRAADRAWPGSAPRRRPGSRPPARRPAQAGSAAAEPDSALQACVETPCELRPRRAPPFWATAWIHAYIGRQRRLVVLGARRVRPSGSPTTRAIAPAASRSSIGTVVCRSQ